MICPNMATMLCTILTDASIESELIKESLQDAVRDSFNSITVDGDMSTNDTVLMLANGEAGSKKIVKNSSVWKLFRRSLNELCLDLAQMIVKDAEGGTKFVTITVTGAITSSDAKELRSLWQILYLSRQHFMEEILTGEELLPQLDTQTFL